MATEHLTPTQAAAVIGCTPDNVRKMIRKGELNAVEVRIPGGWYYAIKPADAERIRDNPPTQRGTPRGSKRRAS